jgi:lambda repressor-like predicted transcriptional regulator
MPPGLHREDVKALIRKRFGSLRAFERAKGLPDKSVSGVLRGRASERVERAIGTILSPQTSPTPSADDRKDNRERRASHQNREKAA